ncbi:unnamed protein product, partial [Prorocentrum cordatum]
SSDPGPVLRGWGSGAGRAGNHGPSAASWHASPMLRNTAVNPGWPVMYAIIYDKPGWDPELELEYDVMPRDEFGVPAHIPQELSTTIRHTYYIPPQYYPFLQKLGHDTPELKPYMDKLMNGEMTFDDYEELRCAGARGCQRAGAIRGAAVTRAGLAQAGRAGCFDNTLPGDAGLAIAAALDGGQKQGPSVEVGQRPLWPKLPAASQAGSSDWMEGLRFGEGGEMCFPPRGQGAGDEQGTASIDVTDGDVALVSLGSYCGIKLSFRKLGIGSATLPFDWMRTRIEKVIEFLQTDFGTFYDGLDDPIAVPGTNLLAFRGDRLQRRIDRLAELGRTSPTTLFVRALCTTDELSRVDELHAELVQRFGGGGNRVFLLAIVCMQERTRGPVVCSSNPGLLLYCLHPSAHEHEKYGGEPAPFCEPVAWALRRIRRAPAAEEALEFPSAAALLASGGLTRRSMGLDGMNGVASFAAAPAADGGQDAGPAGAPAAAAAPAAASAARGEEEFPAGARVEAEYLGTWYLATVLRTPQATGTGLWEVQCDVDPAGTRTTVLQVRAAPTEGGEAFRPGGAAAARALDSLEAGQSDWMDAIRFDEHGAMACPPEGGIPPSESPGDQPTAADEELSQGGVALVSLGCYCGVKLSFRRLGAGAATLPLDWMRTRIEKVIEFIQTDFGTFYDGLSGPIEVPCTNLLAFRGNGHSFWHDDIRQPETKCKLQRRIDRLFEIGQTSATTLFVRALATTDELSHVDALHAELLRRFGSDGNRMFLLAIVCRQKRTVGPMVRGKDVCRVCLVHMAYISQAPEKSEDELTQMGQEKLQNVIGQADMMKGAAPTTVWCIRSYGRPSVPTVEKARPVASASAARGEMTFDDYEEMFYKFAKPLKIHRPVLPMPYRTAEETPGRFPASDARAARGVPARPPGGSELCRAASPVLAPGSDPSRAGSEIPRTPEIEWEGAWLSFRQRVMGDYMSRLYLREFIGGMGLGLFFAFIYIQAQEQGGRRGREGGREGGRQGGRDGGRDGEGEGEGRGRRRRRRRRRRMTNDNGIMLSGWW